MKNSKKQTLKSDKLSSRQVFNSKGYTFYGSDHQGKSDQNNVPEDSYFGTSESGGNITTSFYSLQSHEPVRYGPTDDDTRQIVQKFPNYIFANSILSIYPWLNPLPTLVRWSETSSLLRESKTPLYKYLGKGLGKVKFYKVASPIIGTQDLAGTTIEITNTGLTVSTKPDPNILYPFNGYIYSGTLVQLISQVNEETGVEETRVIPYQNGRGVPQYSSRYLPNGVPPLTPFAPYGELTWDSGDTMNPSLATGVTPGHNHAAVGIVLDTECPICPNRRLFREVDPNGFDVNTLKQDPHTKYYDHPAPQTASAESTVNERIPNEQGFYSPGPNLSETYYSPWPRYYAYQSDEPVPVLTSGITTARIGAAYNIALMSYGLRQQISATDESWMPINCIPLFQGERIEAGSIVYASVKGHAQTPGPYQTQIIEPDEDNPQTLVVPTGAIGQTPWDPFADSTWGNIGFTGTPGVSFSNIPDTEIATLEVYQDENGDRKSIPGLQQACHGSVIVQAVTTHGPSPSTGNAYYQTPLQNENVTPEEIKMIHEARAAMTGISGRGALSQSVPERAQPIGIVLETVIGTGQWTYTGLPLGNDDTLTIVNVVNGGVSYPDVNSVPLRTNTGAGAGGEAEWDNFNEFSPFFGTILPEVTFSVPGAGYVDGDILTIQDTSLTWDFQYHSNNATVVVTNGSSSLTFQSGNIGSNYSTTEYNAFNLSLNNRYTRFNETGGGFLFPVNTVLPDTYFQSFYPIGTVVRVFNEPNSLYSSLAYFEFNENNSMEPFKNSTAYTTAGPTYFETEQSNGHTLMGRPTINVTEVGPNGEVVSYEFIDYGCGNRPGDRLVLINGSDNNAVIEFPELPPGQQEIVATGPGYADGETYTTESTDGTPAIATIRTFVDPMTTPFNRNEGTPIIFNVSTPIGAPELVRLVDNGLGTIGLFDYAEPRYHSYYVMVNATPTDNAPHRGGTNYGVNEVTTNVSCYNISANSYRGYFTITNQVITGQGTFDYTLENFLIDESRYVFNDINGTDVKILLNGTPEDFQEVRKLVSLDTGILVTSQVKAGGLYPLPDGDYVFETQRMDQTNPTVDITTDSNGYVRQVKLRDRGENNQNGDIIIILAGDNNAIFQFNDNMEYIDLPPYARVPGYRVQDDDEAWQRYSDIMSSAVNLMDRQVLIELRESGDGGAMENVYPQAAIGSNRAPPSSDMYQNSYDY